MKDFNSLLIAFLFSFSSTLIAQSKNQRIENFKMIDTDRNEVITIREMKEYYNGKTNEGGQPIDAKKMFYGFDANRNSIITLNEFTQGFNLKLAKEYAERWEYLPTEQNNDSITNGNINDLSDTFDKMDSNLNESLSKLEVVNYYRGMIDDETGKPINGKLNFHTYDANSDGTVTFEEFKMNRDWEKGMERMANAENNNEESADNNISELNLQKRIELFEEIDTDGNLKLNLEELKEYYKDKVNNQGEPVNAEFQLYGLDKDEDGLVSLSEFASKIDVELAKRRYKTRKQ